MSRNVESRTYNSTGRRQGARATRRRIREAAERLFVERGYVATTIEAIAAQAGVAVQTVYFVFGNKRALLSEVLDVAVVGDDAPVPLAERPWLQEVRAERDPVQALGLAAHHGGRLLARMAALYEVLRGAAATDPEIAALLRQSKEERLATQTAWVRLLAERGSLVPGLDAARAGDIVFALFSHELYQLLVVDRGWSPDDWERWLTATLAAQLLGRPADPEP